MLQMIRDHAQGWIAWGIVILISIPFAVWGVHNYVSNASSVGVAKVNGVEIELPEFQQALQRQRNQLRSLLGTDASRLIDDARLRDATLRRLVTDEVILQTARAAGMRIGDAQLAYAIQHQKQFLADGKFSPVNYRQFLSGQGLSPGRFERDYQRSLLLEQVADGVTWSAFVTQHELDRLARLSKETRRYAELVVSAAKYRNPQAVSDDAVRARYEQNKTGYQSPEQVRLAYLEVSRAKIAQGIEVSDADLRALYESQKANFSAPERRKASHILIQVANGADAKTVAAARKRIDAIRREYEQGAKFADLARKYSEDPGSAKKGGDLGYFERGIMEPSFEKAAFSMSVGDVSEPIRTLFGWHLIKLTGIDKTHAPSFDEVRPRLLKDARAQRAEKIYLDDVERVSNLTFENPESLEPAADAVGLQVKETGFVARDGEGGEGIAKNPKVLEAAFSADVLSGGNNSEAIDVDDGRVVVVRVLEHRAAARRPLAEVSAEIRSELAAEAAGKAAAKAAAALLDRLRTGEPAAQVAANAALSWTAERSTTRSAAKGENDVIDTVFKMARPSGDTPRFDALQLGNGDVVIVALRGVTEGEIPQNEAAKTARRTLSAQHGGGAFSALSLALRSRAKIETFKQNLR